MIGEKQLNNFLRSQFLLNVKDIDCLNLAGELGQHLYSVPLIPRKLRSPQPAPVIS